ncbi:hypothetical protein [Haloarcula sp. JP-L23]|uniref:DUF7130 family rubredoxin-like protein n=1 Tax=Haloarcula sp. JP-L23 TaxID=2716717 RepID=UPI00140EAD46|nr:hypothetical protein G9465_06710 [Haloarcula sp. JP-L23]
MERSLAGSRPTSRGGRSPHGLRPTSDSSSTQSAERWRSRTRSTPTEDRPGQEFGEGALTWRCEQCGEMGEGDDGRPDRCLPESAPNATSLKTRFRVATQTTSGEQAEGSGVDTGAFGLGHPVAEVGP